MTLVVAIDGPAAAGKGTLARRLAATFGLAHLDTGKLYRAVGRKLLLAGHDPADPAAATDAAHALTAADLLRADLRGPQADHAASLVAAIAPVRAALLAFQRNFAHESPGAVLDGRDIGTVICPHADAKLFVTATVAARAARRFHELSALGQAVTLAGIETDMRARDALDQARAAAPLRAADDAVLIDTTSLTADQVFARAEPIVRSAARRASSPTE